MTHLPLLALVLLAVSALFSMIGMGGGILYVPILLLAGFSIQQASPTSLILITATSLSALATYWRHQRVDWRLALVIDPPTDVMAFVGGCISSLVPVKILEAVLVGVLLLAGILMLRPLPRSHRVIAPPRSRRYWRREFRGITYTVDLPPVLLATGAIGLLSGMLGITGGIIKLPIMVLLCGVPMDIAVATSTVMVTATALSGLIGHAIRGTVPWHAGLVLAGAAVAGGLVGSRISLAIDRARLRTMFGIVVLAIAARIALRLCA